MKKITRYICTLLLCGSCVFGVSAQSSRPGGSAGRAASGSVSTPRQGASSRSHSNSGMRQSSSSRSSAQPSRNGGAMGRREQSGVVARPAGSSGQPRKFNSTGVQSRPGTRPSSARPATPAQGVRPGSATSTPSRPGNQGTRPSTRPSTQPGGTRLGNQGNRPGQGTTTRPGNSHRPGAGNRPDAGYRPGGDHRPGGNHKPGGNHRPGGGRPGGSSAPRPGGWAPVRPPHNNWVSPGYRPPRPNGGYWGPPAPARYRIGYWVPPMPPRYTYAHVGVPTLGTILGLTFGSFIDAGINSLYSAGYNVAGYADNVIYLSNVTQLGMLWPQVSMNYTNGLLTNSQFIYSSVLPDVSRFNLAYTQLCALYGSPVSNTGTTMTWWAGDNTGYITLNYSFMNSLQGVPGYYTTVTYSAYY